MQHLYRQAEERARQTAIVYADERIDFGDLVERIERVADGLAQRGIGPGDSVGLVTRNDSSYVIAFHAVAALGSRVVPANPAFKEAELDFWFRSTGVSAVISDPRNAAACERIAASLPDPAQVIVSGVTDGDALTLADVAAAGTPRRLEPRSPEEPLVCQFSSGSTGLPKRLNRTHGQCAAEAEAYLGLGLGPEDRILATVPLFHTWGMGACIFSSAISGAPIVFLEDPHPFLLRRDRALELIEREGVTVFPGVPFNFRLLAEAPGEADLSSLRLAFSAGMALPREAFDAFGDRFGIFVRQLYGSTEAGMIAANLSSDPVATFESVGRPVKGVEVEIVDEAGEPVAAGEVGEVTVSSPAMTDGYVGLEELNKEAFRDGRFFTGDLGRLAADGTLTLVGRKKLLIETGGFKIDPIEVEAVIDGFPGVAESVVVGVDTKVPGEQLVKAVVVRSGECDERELLRFCRSKLANYKVPGSVEFRSEIPRSPLGKILRKYLV